MRGATGYFASLACALSLFLLAPASGRAQNAPDADAREVMACTLNADQPGGQLPPGISQANVDLYRKHAADMEQLGAESEDSTCGAEESTPG